MFQRAGVGQDSRQRVVVARGNRIELVIVAASTTDRLGQKPFANRIQLLINNVHAKLPLVLFFEVVIAERQVCRRDQLPLSIRQRFGRKQIAGELFDDKSIEGQVGIERLDDVIAIAPGFGQDEPAQSQRFAEPRDA